jgi:hypothetical protein
MCTYSPSQLAELIENLPLDGPHVLIDKVGPPGVLSHSHAHELLRVARGLSEWHKIVATLVIGDLYFDNDFVDYAVDMLKFPASGKDSLAVIMHANNLLLSRKTITRDQYNRITQLPDDTPGKQTLLASLKGRVA